MKRTNNIKDVLGFNDTWVLLVGIPLVAFFIPILFFKANLSDGFLAYLPKFGISLTHTIVYWLSIRQLFIFMRRQYPTHQDTRKRVLYTIAGILVIFVVVDFLLHYVIEDHFGLHGPPEVREIDYKIASLMVIALISTLYESVFLYFRWKQSIIEAEQLKREHVESQLEGLKSQVNPHFLFNSLNTLTYIIPEDPDKAVTFVRKLSKVYRYVLEIREKKLISLKEELEFLHSYIFLVKERFGENLNVCLDLSADFEEALVVPLSLQILFENAIKHNIISSQMPLTIDVYITEDHRLIVRNNLQKKRQTMPSTKVGLQNIRNRYAFFSDEKVTVQESDRHFEVSLPLIKVPVKTFE